MKLSNYCRFIFVITLLSLSPFLVFAQSGTGKVAGKIINDKNEPLPGVTIKIKNVDGGVQSGVDGTYAITLNADKKYTLVFSFTGYETKEIEEVEVKSGAVTPLDIVLNYKASTGLGNVVVSAQKRTARLETVNSAIQFQKNTSVVAAVVSAEAIRRSPDKNTGEILKRVPGLSVQDNKYLIVRGLSDRYNQAMLNGVLLSSTEADRKTFSFDIFPSSTIDNIIVNKAFIPELSGEWAGGLVQVNTKDIPSANFFNVEIGTGINSTMFGNDFYKYNGSNMDWLGFDNKTRALPSGIPNKSTFAALSNAEKTALGASFANNWDVYKAATVPNMSLQASGGFTGRLFNKKVGGIIGANYSNSRKVIQSQNSFYSISDNLASPDFIYNTGKSVNDVLWGALANFTIALNSNNKVSVKNLFNVNATNYTSLRDGEEYISGTDNVRSRELAMKTTSFFNTQLLGEHNMPSLDLKLNWFGSFNILDQYIPEQRRLEYVQTNQVGNYEARVSTGQSQKSGSIFYSNLSDYIYTAGGDLTKKFKLFNNTQSVKAGYFFQVKDRLFDSRPFYIQLYDNSLKTLSENQIFAQENFAAGKLGFDEFSGKQFRYMANSILNAGFIQFDNAFTDNLRVVWGVRYENFDQLIGSTKKTDPRFVNNKTGDYLPAINLTYKLNSKTNIRLSGSQTVVRPEFRELSSFAFYDFELGATVLGNQNLVRTKITNADLRYELYPRAGELITLGVFYKHFESPIELYLNQSGAGSSNTFNYPDNIDTRAKGYGVEFEIRKKLDFSHALRNFTFTSNLAYIHNRVENNSISLDRPMQGQSPYLINAGLLYDLQNPGFTASVLFNQIGRRIAYVGNDQVPVIWEAPRPLLDLQLTKKVLHRKGELKLNISDIINKKAQFYHDLNDDGNYSKINDALAIGRRYGTTFSLSFAYNIK